MPAVVADQMSAHVTSLLVAFHATKLALEATQLRSFYASLLVSLYKLVAPHRLQDNPNAAEYLLTVQPAYLAQSGIGDMRQIQRASADFSEGPTFIRASSV